MSRCSSLSEENLRPSKEGVYKVAIAAMIVQLHIWLTAQCKSDSASASTSISSNSYAYAPAATKL